MKTYITLRMKSVHDPLKIEQVAVVESETIGDTEILLDRDHMGGVRVDSVEVTPRTELQDSLRAIQVNLEALRMQAARATIAGDELQYRINDLRRTMGWEE